MKGAEMFCADKVLIFFFFYNNTTFYIILLCFVHLLFKLGTWKTNKSYCTGNLKNRDELFDYY